MPRKRSRMGYRGRKPLTPIERYPAEPWQDGPACPECSFTRVVTWAVGAATRHWCGSCGSQWWGENK
jgi:hypothetical protein